MFGRVSAGKSSFFNTIDSVFKGRFSGRFETGEGPRSITRWFNGRVTPDSPGYVEFPSVGQRMHCLCFIMDATKVSMVSKEFSQQISLIKTLANARNIRVVILLTKIDKLCSEVEKNVRNAYSSRAVFEVVKQASSLTGIPIAFIYLVKNYSYEMALNPDVDVLALRALRQMLLFCDDILEELDDHERADQ